MSAFSSRSFHLRYARCTNHRDNRRRETNGLPLGANIVNQSDSCDAIPFEFINHRRRAEVCVKLPVKIISLQGREQQHLRSMVTTDGKVSSKLNAQASLALPIFERSPRANRPGNSVSRVTPETGEKSDFRWKERNIELSGKRTVRNFGSSLGLIRFLSARRPEENELHFRGTYDRIHLRLDNRSGKRGRNKSVAFAGSSRWKYRSFGGLNEVLLVYRKIKRIRREFLAYYSCNESQRGESSARHSRGKIVFTAETHPAIRFSTGRDTPVSSPDCG